MSLVEPKIICIMPCFNRENTVAKAIESIINQNYTNWELIIVDDASTDGSTKIIKKYLTDKRITLLQNKNNRGCFYSRNRALFHIKDKMWDWVTTHDADDVSDPSRFSIFMGHSYQKEYHYIFSAGRGTRYDYSQQKLIYQTGNSYSGQAFISFKLFKYNLGYFDNTKFGGDAEYSFRLLNYIFPLVQDNFPHISTLPLLESQCVESKWLVGKLDKKYSYTYTFGYTQGENLTQSVPQLKRNNYIESYKDKWGKGGIPLKDFYIDFIPNEEDL